MRRLLIALLLLWAVVGCAKPAAAPPPTLEPPASVETPPSVEPPPAPEATQHRVTLYTLRNLQGLKAPGPDTWTFQASFTGFSLAPDGETALLYPADPNQPADPPSLLHLPTGKRTPLPVPAADWYCCGGWLGDGRLYLVGGGKLYVGHGADLAPLANVDLAWNAVLSPAGTSLALWGPRSEGAVTLVDLATGAPRTLTTTFRRCADDGGVSLGWSPDGKLLAGTDCVDRQPRIRIVDPAADRLVNEIAGWSLQSWLATGELLAMSPVKGEAAVTTRLDTTGKEVGPAVIMGSPSPDGKYLFYGAYKRQHVLLEYATGRTWALDLAPERAGWTMDGRLYVVSSQ